MEKSRSEYLLKNTAIFTLGNLAMKIISFFLIPLYTNVLTTAEYGTVDLVATVAAVAIPVLTFNIMESVMRFNLDKDADYNKITKIGITVLSVTVMIGLLLIPLSDLFPTLRGLGVFVYLYCVASAAGQIFLADLRGKELLIQYSIGNVINTLLIAVFNIVFLLLFKWGIKGYLLAYISANGSVAVYALIIGKGYKAVNAPIDNGKMREMLKYSIVLIPNSFMWWIMNSSDHLMVTGMIGAAANGVYAISYKVPTLLSSLIGIFNQAWGYSAIREEGSEDVEKYSNRILRGLISVTMIAGVGMMTFIKPFLKIYVSPDYYAAWQYTPFLIIGFVYMTLGTFMGTSYSVHKDSKGFLLSGISGAALNIILNFCLIPLIGVNGAALATCAGYIAVFIFRWFDTKKYLKYRPITKEFAAGTVSLIISAILMYADTLTAQIAQIALFGILLVFLKEYWLDALLAFYRKKLCRR